MGRRRGTTVAACLLLLAVPALGVARTTDAPVVGAAPAAGPRSAVVTGGAAAAGRGDAGRIRLRVYDARGRRLDWRAFRRIQEDGHGRAGDDDMLVDPRSLRVRTAWPLYDDGGDPVLDRPAGPAALTLAWPTADGYSTLVLDLPGPGTYVFPELAGRQALRDLEAQLRRRPGYRPSAAFTASLATARRELAEMDRAATEGARGAHGVRCYEAAVHAELLLLREYGVQSAGRRHAGGSKAGAPDAPLAFTLDDVAGAAPRLRTIRDIVHGQPGAAAVRLVLDLGRAPEDYAPVVRSARALGLRVVGQILDSSQMAAVPLGAWRTRVAHLVRALPAVDTWEVGNEVNGNWLGADVAAKVAFAAGYVKAHTRASTLLTLYWQLGEDDAAHSTFTWAGRLPAATVARIDEIALSVYPEEHPLGAAFDRVVRTLHAAFPGRRISVGELGYGASDLQHVWWFGSPTDTTGTGRAAVADLYARAVLGYPYSGGGPYWWYFRTQGGPSGPLVRVFSRVYADVLRARGAAGAPAR